MIDGRVKLLEVKEAAEKRPEANTQATITNSGEIGEDEYERLNEAAQSIFGL